MDKSFLLGLPTLLCCFRVLSGSFLDREYSHATHYLSLNKNILPEIIQCRMCHLEFPGDQCFKGRGICTAVGEEACITGKIFKNDGRLWLIFRGCLKNCANVDHIRWSIYLVNFRCCRSHDLCNESLGITSPSEAPNSM
ncbi:prostate and testis expressed protein 1 [Pteronotus mesoamericanus]|uniref:prostate and testis expressed protein 1 n=1 Tax=Pteronotus mesoamericanus TaxID=1884717 RepID=UPI0023EC5F3A|nr:prostate and testis expressed protein 1 [Pteronotus parnellii mesoamericanus]